MSLVPTPRSVHKFLRKAVIVLYFHSVSVIAVADLVAMVAMVADMVVDKVADIISIQFIDIYKYQCKTSNHGSKMSRFSSFFLG